MIKAILMSSLTLLALNAENDYQLKFHVNVNSEFKGALTLDSNDSKFKVLYHNITERDKIPFYAPQKDFELIDFQKNQTLASLSVNEIKNTMKYDLTQLTKDQIDDADVSHNDIPNRAIVYNKEQLPVEILDKRLIHTIESLLASIYKTNQVPEGPFYLFEPHKNMLIKVRFTKEGNQQVKLDGKACDAIAWLLEVENRDIKLIRLYTNPYPIKIEASSKSWSFTLAGTGKKKLINVKKDDIAFNSFEKQIKNKYSNYNVEILSQNMSSHMFDKNYETQYKLSRNIEENEIKKHVKSYLKSRYATNSNAERSNSYVYSVDEQKVKELMQSELKTENEAMMYYKNDVERYTKSDLIKTLAKQKNCSPDTFREEIECNGKKESVDIEKEARKRRESDFNKENIKYKIENVKMARLGNVEVTSEILVAIPNEIKMNYIKRVFEKEHEGYAFNHSSYTHDKKEKSYKIFIDKDKVANYACSKIMNGLNAKYIDGVCIANKKQVNKKEEVDSLVNEYLHLEYPDLKALNTKVENHEDSFSFMYLNDLSEVKNACK